MGELTVKALQESDQDRVVVCTASQTFTKGDFNFPVMQKKEVKLDVYCK